MAAEQVTPGWYPDSINPTLEQYWDGSRWTEQRRPVEEKDTGSTALVVVGYITALFLPLIGFILGIVLLVRRQTAHGLLIVLLSIASVLAACAIVVNSTGDTVSCLDKANTMREINRCD